MKHFSLVAVALAIMFSLATPAQAQNKSLIGTLLGAAAGGFGGAQFGKGRGKLVTTALGVLGGAFIGRSVGTSLDRVDQLGNQPVYRSQTIYRSLPAPQPVYRQRPYYSRQNISRPYDTRQYARYNICRSGLIREYQTVVTVGGQQVPSYGRACYMPDGSWQKIGG